MGIYFYKAMITQSTQYVLIDGDGDIRGSAPNLESIIVLRRKNRWGKIHKCEFDGRTLKIGEEIEL